MTLVAELREQGFARVPGVFSPEALSDVGRVIDILIAQWHQNPNIEDFWWYHEQDDDKDVLYRIHNLERKHPIFSELIQKDQYRSTIRMIMDSLSHPTACALVYKMPFLSAAVPWHRDPIDVPPHTVYNLSLFLDKSTQTNGALEFLPYSHTETQIFEPIRPPGAVCVEAEVGDIIIHDVRIFHGSSQSRSPLPRRSIVVEFQPVSLGTPPVIPWK